MSQNKEFEEWWVENYDPSKGSYRMGNAAYLAGQASGERKGMERAAEIIKQAAKKKFIATNCECCEVSLLLVNAAIRKEIDHE